MRDSKGILLQCTCNIEKTNYDLKECPVHGIKESIMEKGKIYAISEIEKNEFEQNLDFQLRMIKEFLIEKNKAYGNSALNPIRIFSKADTKEQLNVRIDDKLNRLLQGTGYPKDDDELDLLGYLILKRMA